jgi:hypothetical protein
MNPEWAVHLPFLNAAFPAVMTLVHSVGIPRNHGLGDGPVAFKSASGVITFCDYVPAPPDAHLPSLADQVEFVSSSDGQYRIRILPHWQQALETRVVAWGDCVRDELLHRDIGLGYYCVAALHRGVGEIGVGRDGLKRDRYYHVWFPLLPISMDPIILPPRARRLPHLEMWP